MWEDLERECRWLADGRWGTVDGGVVAVRRGCTLAAGMYALLFPT